MTADNHANDDLKAKMREALDRKNAKAKGVSEEGTRLRGPRRSRPEDAPPQGGRRGLLTGRVRASAWTGGG